MISAIKYNQRKIIYQNQNNKNQLEFTQNIDLQIIRIYQYYNRNKNIFFNRSKQYSILQTIQHQELHNHLPHVVGAVFFEIPQQKSGQYLQYQIKPCIHIRWNSAGSVVPRHRCSRVGGLYLLRIDFWLVQQKPVNLLSLPLQNTSNFLVFLFEKFSSRDQAVLYRQITIRRLSQQLISLIQYFFSNKTILHKIFLCTTQNQKQVKTNSATKKCQTIPKLVIAKFTRFKSSSQEKTNKTNCQGQIQKENYKTHLNVNILFLFQYCFIINNFWCKLTQKLWFLCNTFPILPHIKNLLEI
eukprot:TRINITY_DN28512_c0_g1_i5.p1 TRINITY_DN28512_c0_g1~~TRINITY_DN28512_c0_g1_i5.p1  ORF type:complete len:315 (-),score=-6.04 TRINITY_DN28512_c0_g1_i5:48-941(-)